MFFPLFLSVCLEGELLISVPSNSVNNWSNQQAAELYVQALVSYCTAYPAPYLLLGNENDMYYEQNSTDYLNWISVYNSAYKAIKSSCPETIVGPTFQYVTSHAPLLT